MNLTAAIPDEELLLARLTCSKLARMAQGLTSTGLASFELAPPTEFVAERVKSISAMIEVLRCIGVKPGSGQAAQVLREKADQLAHLADQYFGQFVRLAHWRSMAPADVQELASLTAASCVSLLESLESFSRLLGMEPDFPVEKEQAGRMIEEFFGELCAH